MLKSQRRSRLGQGESKMLYPELGESSPSIMASLANQERAVSPQQFFLGFKEQPVLVCSTIVRLESGSTLLTNTSLRIYNCKL